MSKIIIVLDNVRSAFNVGSVFRTADGLGAEVHLIGITPIPGQDSKLEKTSLSSLESVAWKHFELAESWFKYNLMMKLSNHRNYIFSLEEGHDYPEISLFDIKKLEIPEDSTVFLVFGHEINGVSKFIMDKSDKIIKIPMYGKKNSLNVATCVGIVGYRFKELTDK